MDDKVTFGSKHKGTTWREVVDKDPGWVSWAHKNVEWLSLDPEILRAIGEPVDVPHVPAAPKTAAESTKISLDVLSDMINAMAVLGAGIVEHPSLGAMIVVPMQDVAVLGRIQAHLVEMERTLTSGSAFHVTALPAERKTAEARPSAYPPDEPSIPEWTDPTDDLPF